MIKVTCTEGMVYVYPSCGEKVIEVKKETKLKKFTKRNGEVK